MNADGETSQQRPRRKLDVSWGKIGAHFEKSLLTESFSDAVLVYMKNL